MNERIWIFVSSAELSAEQVKSLENNCQGFIEGWSAHEKKLSASFEIHGGRLLLFKVNEAVYNASGCSIDKLTHFIKDQEKLFSVDFLNRLLVAYEKDGKVEVVHSSKIKELLESGVINADTLVYDNTISYSDQFHNWKKPLKDTWLNKYLPSYTS